MATEKTNQYTSKCADFYAAVCKKQVEKVHIDAYYRQHCMQCIHCRPPDGSCSMLSQSQIPEADGIDPEDGDDSWKPLYWRNPNYNIPDESRFYRLPGED